MFRQFWTELWYLLLFMAGGFVLILVLSMLAGNLSFLSAVTVMHLVQWGQNLLVFILPTLFWVRWYLKKPISATLGLRKAPLKYYLIAIALVLVVSFPMDWLAEWSKEALPLPEVFRQMAEDESKQQESILQEMLSPSGFFGWMECILLMSVLTAIAEELVFRGAILSSFIRTGVNRHLTAILVGLIFSIIHFDLYGLIPRWILGTLFCYLYFWSGSLFPPILAHALNNLLALIQYKSGELF